MRSWIVVVMSLSCACGKSDKPAASGSGSATTPPAAPANAPAKKGVTGSVTTSGLVAATWSWKDDLALDCDWVADLGMGGLHVTLNDGGDGAMALDAVFSKDDTHVTATSVKFDSPRPFKQDAGGVVISSTGTTPTTITAQFDAVMTRGDQTLNLKGTLTARCN